MRRLKLVGSTAVGIVIGATLLNAVPAYADLPTIDAGAIAAIEAVDDPELRAAITEAARSNLAWQEERTRPLPVVEGTRAARGLRVPPPKLRG